jgi:hypothetical protein
MFIIETSPRNKKGTGENGPTAFTFLLGNIARTHDPELLGPGRFQTDFPLRERDDDPGVTEQLVDTEPNVALEKEPLQQGLHADPEMKGNDPGVVSEITEKHEKLGVLQNFLVLLGRPHQETFDLADRGTVCRPDRDVRPHLLVGQGPGPVVLFQEAAVGN